MKISRNFCVNNFHDVSRKRAQLGSAAQRHRHKQKMLPAIVQKDADKGANLRARFNRKTLLASLSSMNFLGSPDEIHSA
jgi:hypothetical protein